MLVVADSSPLLYLSRIGLLDVLRLLYGEVVVPAVVWAELVHLRPEAGWRVGPPRCDVAARPRP